MARTGLLVPTLLLAVLLAACTAASTAPTSSNSTAGDQQDVSGVPDYPLDNVPTTPVSAQFVLEHRTALNGRTVTLRGTVLRLLAPSPTAGGGLTPQPGAYFVPRVFLDAGPAGAGQPNNELMVLLREDDTDYKAQQTIEFPVVVQASAVAIVVQRVYSD